MTKAFPHDGAAETFLTDAHFADEDALRNSGKQRVAQSVQGESMITPRIWTPDFQQGTNSYLPLFLPLA